MEWHTQILGKWADFIELVERLQVHEESRAHYWWLRGQVDKRWELEPSLLRYFVGAEVSPEKALGIEMTALRLFLSQAHLHLRADIVDRGKWSVTSWWTLMQHHSCPTRLLEWTESPFVAAYFAVQELPNLDGAIWFFPAPCLDTIMSKRYGRLSELGDDAFLGPDAAAALYPIMGAVHTERMAAQQSVCTVSTSILGNHGHIIAEAFKGQEDRFPLNKAIIPARLKNEFLSRLRVMNITAASLFPGIDGVGRSVSEAVRLRAASSR